MTHRGQDGPDQLRALFDDDAALDAIGRGHTPDDELGQLLASLRDDARAPHAPFNSDVIADAQHGEDAAGLPADELSERRGRSGRRTRKPMSAPVAGVIGAAAASIVMAIGGFAFLGPAQSAQEARVVELASTLEEIDSKAGEGDMDATRSLLAEARNLVAELDRRDGRAERDEKPTTQTSTSTPTSTEPESAEKKEPAAPPTVTETVTVTHTVTPSPAPQPGPASSMPAPRPQTSPSASPTATPTQAAPDVPSPAAPAPAEQSPAGE